MDFKSNNTHTLCSFIPNYIYETCPYIYKYNYVNDFVYVGIKSLHIVTKKTINDRAGDLVGHAGRLFRKVAYSSNDARSLKI